MENWQICYYFPSLESNYWGRGDHLKFIPPQRQQQGGKGPDPCPLPLVPCHLFLVHAIPVPATCPPAQCNPHLLPPCTCLSPSFPQCLPPCHLPPVPCSLLPVPALPFLVPPVSVFPLAPVPASSLYPHLPVLRGSGFSSGAVSSSPAPSSQAEADSAALGLAELVPERLKLEPKVSSAMGVGQAVPSFPCSLLPVSLTCPLPSPSHSPLCAPYPHCLLLYTPPGCMPRPLPQVRIGI